MTSVAVALLVALPILIAVLIAASPSGATWAIKRPTPPTGVQAVSVAGAPGVTVSWSAPVSDGGSPILFYVASTYNGKFLCTSPNPGPNTCQLTGIKNGSVPQSIRVRAINVRGPGQAAATTSVVTRGAASGGGGANGGGGPTTSPSPTSQSAAGAPTITSANGGGESLAGDASSDQTGSAGTDVPAELPFTGINLLTLLTAGLVLVLAGLFMVGPVRRRRQVVHRYAASVYLVLFGL